MIAYPFSVICRRQSMLLVWVNGDGESGDCFLKDADGKIFILRSTLLEKPTTLTVNTNEIVLRWDEWVEVDLDKFFAIVYRLSHKVLPRENTCSSLLAGWNCLEDLARTLDLRRDIEIFEDQSLGKMYQKIFYGNNLPSITPEGKKYTPIWTQEEVLKFKRAILELWCLIKNKAPELSNMNTGSGLDS